MAQSPTPSPPDPTPAAPARSEPSAEKSSPAPATTPVPSTQADEEDFPPARASDPPRLEELKDSFRKDRQSERRTVLQKYRQALIKLERSLAQERDYRAATAVRDERLAVEKRLAALDQRTPGEAPMRPYPGGPITLSAREAEVAGGVSYDEAHDALEGWKSSGSRAQWKLPFPLAPGGYEIVLEMACAPGSGGEVTVREDFHTLTRKVQPTQSWEDFGSQSLGTLRIKPNATGLDLHALTVEGDGLFLLRCVKLVPIAPDAQ